MTNLILFNQFGILILSPNLFNSSTRMRCSSCENIKTAYFRKEMELETAMHSRMSYKTAKFDKVKLLHIPSLSDFQAHVAENSNKQNRYFFSPEDYPKHLN